MGGSILSPFDKFRIFITNEDQPKLIEFLKSLSKEDKKELADPFNALAKEYLEYQNFNGMLGLSVKRKASETQVRMIEVTGFVCLNRREFEKINPFDSILLNNLLEDTLPWYCPDWFSDHVNALTKREWFPPGIHYDLVVTLEEKGYLKPSDELVARLFPGVIFDRIKDWRTLRYAPENIEKRKITLQTHLWIIFQLESSISVSSSYVTIEGAEGIKGDLWIATLKKYVVEGKIDRRRILKESLLAAARNFGTWFTDLFQSLEPTSSELIALQPELFTALSSRHSKTQNTILGILKQIADSPDFNTGVLLENMPLLLSSETKSVVNSALMLLEKAGRSNPASKEEISITACQAFIHNDENIQSRTAKLLLKFNTSSSTVHSEIDKYSGSMLMSTRKILSEFISDKEEQIVATENSVIATTADEPQPLAEINSIDDLVFLASQAFDNNDPMHLDLLPAALVNLQDRLTESDLAKLEPSIQRAYKITKGNANAGVLDDLLGTFLVEVMRVFAGKFPRTGEFLKTIEAEYTRKDEERKKQWAEFKARVMNLEHWRTSDNDTSYQIHKRVLYAAFVQISNGTKLPLLSTPTHQYGFIDPVVLVDRIALLQQRYFVPYTIDFQVAISRIAPFNHEVALQQVKGKLKGEPLRVMEFLLRKDAAPVPPFDTPELWFVAGVTKLPGHVYNEFRNFVHSERRRSIYTGEAEWTVSIEKNKRYDFGQRKDIELETTSTFLRIEHHNTMGEEARQQQPTEGLLTKLSGLFSKKKVEAPETASYSVIHEFLRRSNGFLNASHGDVTRLIYLFPNNPDPVIALFGLQRLFESTLSSEMDKEVVTQIQRAVLPLQARNSETSHLFIATCMLTSDKTVRAFAAEMWIRAVRSCITSVRTGEIIGKELGLGYAPVKRFTDLTSSNLLQVSQVHNRELEILLNNVLPGLPDEPPTGTKRLLELYSEILAINKSSVTEPGLKAKLQSWSSSPSLKKAVASLL